MTPERHQPAHRGSASLDERLLVRWVSEHAQSVSGYLQAMVRDRHAADDLLQEVFFRAWQARDRYAEQGKERAYLLCIADRLARDRGRRAGRETPLDDVAWHRIEPAAADEEPLAALLRSEARHRLSQAMETLSEPQRRTLLLRYYGGLDFREIAHILECPVNTALSHSRRGLATLRRMLAEPAETQR